jgi:CBS domain-containing protein
MNVREIMTSPVVTVDPSTTVAEVARLMLERNVSGLPVVDADGRMVGLITKADVVEKHAQVHLPTYLGILGYAVPIRVRHSDEEIRHVLAVTAQDLMGSNPATIDPESTVDKAATLMVEHSVNPVPVLENGRLVGIIGYDDIIRVLLQEE